MKINAMFPRNYITGADLNGKAYLTTIEEVREERMRTHPGAEPETRYVMYLAGTGKGVILNRTIGEQISAIVGSDDTDNWKGHRIVIFPVPVDVAGQKRVAIRARAPKDSAPTSELKSKEA